VSAKALYEYTTLTGTTYHADIATPFADNDVTIELLPDTKTAIASRKRNRQAIITAHNQYTDAVGDGLEELNDFVVDMLSRITFTNATTPWGKCDNCNSVGRVYSYEIELHGFFDTGSQGGSLTWKPNSAYIKCVDCVPQTAMQRLFNLMPMAYLNTESISNGLHSTRYKRYFHKNFYEFPVTDVAEPNACVCTRYVFETDITRIIKDNDGNEKLFHANCTRYCGLCETSYLDRFAWRIMPDNFTPREQTFVNGGSCCADCAHEWTRNNPDAKRCENCNFLYDEDNIRYSEERERDLCDSCYDNPISCSECGWSFYEGRDHTCYLESGSNIYDYSYKPRPRFFGAGRYWLGFELEVELDSEGDSEECNEQAGRVNRRLGEHAYCKNDGSLDYGFEIVSHPHTLEEFHNLDWEFMRDLRSNGFVSWNNSNCGIHVHVSNTAFAGNTQKETDMHRIRFAKFIYDNQHQVERIAGRKENSYAQFTDKGRVVNKMLTGNQAEGRYEVVNIANSNTIEVRIFKGSLRVERLLSDIEFVHAVVEFTRNMKVVAKDKPFSWSRFVKFAVENDTQYPNLNTIINEAFSSERIKAEI
jgi:hypothetical protein